jgi:hypothetical protein
LGVINTPLLKLVLILITHAASLETRHTHRELLACKGLESLLEVVDGA